MTGIALAIERRLGSRTGEKQVQLIEFEYSLGPSRGAADIDVIIVSVFVAFFEDTVWIVQVELVGCIICRKIAFRELVDVDIKIAAQQVIYAQEVVVALGLMGYAGGEVDESGQLRIENRIEIVSLGVDDTVLQYIEGATSADIISRNAVGVGDGGIIGAVDVVEPLPVDLPKVDIGFHPIVEQLSLDRIGGAGPGGGVAGQIAVIVGARVGCVVPIEGGDAPVAEGKSGGGDQRCFVVQPIIVCEQEHGLMGAAHAGITFDAVLVSPVRVVIVGSCQVEHFPNGRSLTAVFGRCSECCEGEQVFLSDAFVDRHKITPAIEVSTRHISLAGPASAGTEREGPTFFTEPG